MNAGTWREKDDVDEFDFLMLLGDTNLYIPKDLAAIRNSLDVLGICTHAMLTLDGRMAEEIIPDERKRAGLRVLKERSCNTPSTRWKCS